MSDEEDIIDPLSEVEIEEEVVENPNSESDDDDDVNVNDIIMDDIEDINVFKKNYSKLLKENKSNNVLSKYEKTKILAKRCEQLESGCQPLISYYENFNNVYDIALEEFNNKKIPFIIKRFINNKYEYFKLEDLIY